MARLLAPQHYQGEAGGRCRLALPVEAGHAPPQPAPKGCSCRARQNLGGLCQISPNPAIKTRYCTLFNQIRVRDAHHTRHPAWLTGGRGVNAGARFKLASHRCRGAGTRRDSGGTPNYLRKLQLHKRTQ